MYSAKNMGSIKARNLAALMFCFLLTLLGGIMAASLIFIQADTKEKLVAELKMNQASMATAVSGFYSERFSDFYAITGTKEFYPLLESLAASKSHEQHPNISLAKKRLFDLKASKVLTNKPVYSRICFVSLHGELVIDTLNTSNTSHHTPEFWSRLVSGREKKPEILVDAQTSAVCVPVFFKTIYTGQLVGFINPSLRSGLYRDSTKTDTTAFALMPDSGKTRMPNGIALDGMINGNMDLSWFNDPQGHIVTGTWHGLKNRRILVLGTRVKDTPFRIVSLTRCSGISLKMTIGLIIIQVLFLGTCIFFILKNATSKLIMRIRLSEARAGEQRLKQIVENLPLPIAEYGLDRKIRYANKAALKAFGFNRQDIENGLSILKMLDKDERNRIRKWMQSLKKGEHNPLVITAHRKDGRKLRGSIVSQKIIENGTCTGMRLCFIDLTQRLKQEKATLMAAKQEKYALIGQVAGKMAHDFNNILGAIMGNAELTLLDCTDPETYHTLEIILAQVKRGRILTQNLVAFAKDQEITEKYFNINEKLDLVTDLLKKELQKTNIVKDYETDPPELLADPGMIEHALVNLIQNAVHAMAKTGTPELTLITRSHENSLTIVVQDNGCGIPDAYADQIFVPAFSLKGSRDMIRAYPENLKGSGYGLSNVKKYIDKHKGTIEFTSEAGHGTRFTITLPLRARDLLPEEKNELVEKNIICNRQILIVEDEDVISAVLKKILTSAPFFHTVEIARDGDAARELLSRQDFDLVSLDYILPGRSNGLDIYNEIRKTRKTLPVIFISGNIRFLESMEVLKASDPYVDHLSKPFKNIEYADKVNEWLQGILEK